MSEETTKLIKELAEKFGTTAEHLWGVLVKQAPINSAINLAVFSVVAIAAIVFVPMAIHKSKKDDDVSWLAIPAVGFTLATLVMAVEVLPIALAGFLNPEFWALKQFIK